jgi:hypothetical protein
MNRTTLFLGSATALGLTAVWFGVLRPPTQAPAPKPVPPPIQSHNELPRDFNAPFQHQPQIPQPPARPISDGHCRGYTWALKEQREEIAHVGAGVEVSNAYIGDTLCERSLPVLCVNPQGLAAPAGAQPYNGWLGGKLALSKKVQGTSLVSRDAATRVCEKEFGKGWRIGEHHDGNSAWGFAGYGHIAPDTRFWVAINNQPANPWNYLAQPSPPPPQPGPACVGYTWGVREQNGAQVSVGSVAGSNAYAGDTSCDISLPLLCVLLQNLPVTGPTKLTAYNGWLGGKIAVSKRVKGRALTSRMVADELCSTQFGTGWRIGEHHDGIGHIGWGFTGYGEISKTEKFWVAINDSAANPWNYLAKE